MDHLTGKIDGMVHGQVSAGEDEVAPKFQELGTMGDDTVHF